MDLYLFLMAAFSMHWLGGLVGLEGRYNQLLSR